MKQRISNFLKSLSKTDWIKLSVFIPINIIYCIAFYFIRLFIVVAIDDYFPPQYHSDGIFNIRSAHPLAYTTAEYILLALMLIWTIAFLHKLQPWLLSLPIQFLLCFATCYLLAPAAAIWAQLVVKVLIVQAIGVAIGLGIRKAKARKQPILA